MALLDRIVARAKAERKTIILPEGEDMRTIEAAVKCKNDGIANVIMLGNEEEIKAKAGDFDLSGIKIINPLTSDMFDGFVEQYTEMRKAKGMTQEKAREELKDSVYFGCMMLYNDMADGLVSGAVHATSELLRPALKIIKTAPGISTVSSYFLMEFPNKESLLPLQLHLTTAQRLLPSLTLKVLCCLSPQREAQVIRWLIK